MNFCSSISDKHRNEYKRENKIRQHSDIKKI
jgi:hypothetical protein